MNGSSDLTDVCPKTRDAFSLCFKSVMVYQGGMIVEVNLGRRLSYLLYFLFLLRHRQRQKENMKEQYSF